MKKIQKSLFAFALAGLCLAHSASAVTLNTSFGVLSDSTGNPLADGSLLQLIASTDATIDGGDLLLAAWGLNSATSGVPGGDENSIGFNLGQSIPTLGGGTASAQGGMLLFLRFFATPVESEQVGIFRTDTPEFGAPWVIPGDNSATVMIALATEGYGGTLPDSAASTAPATDVIPEPTTGVLVGLSLLSLAGLVRRRR
jgi:hypothetical protein